MDQDTLDKLASGEYSISPRSGRLRKKIKIKKKKSAFSKSQLKKAWRVFLWVLLLLAFVVSLVLVIPDLLSNANPKRPNDQNSGK